MLRHIVAFFMELNHTTDKKALVATLWILSRRMHGRSFEISAQLFRKYV